MTAHELAHDTVTSPGRQRARPSTTRQGNAVPQNSGARRGSPDSVGLLNLQRAIGNRAVQRLVGQVMSTPVQRTAGPDQRWVPGVAATVIQRDKKVDTRSPGSVTAQTAQQNLRTAIGATTAAKCKKALAKRLPNGPPFTRQDVDDIEELSQDAVGAAWLAAAGIGMHSDAENYLKAGNYKDWLTRPVGERLLIAAIAWFTNHGRDDENPPPSYTLGRHMAIASGTALPKAVTERDTHIRQTFVRTMTPAVQDPGQLLAIAGNDQKVVDRTVDAAQILTRLFLILQRGLQVYDVAQSDHIDYKGGDVARALAHGGRVNIRIPALRGGETSHDLTDWLGITQAGKTVGPTVEKRGFGTHHMNITKNKPAKPGKNKPARRGKFEEEGGKGASAANKRAGRKKIKLWGMDVAAGGMGNLDFNGDTILPDGGHGHMFIGLTKPTRKKDGALQVGMETTGPGAPSLVGYKHTWKSTEATANPESSFYGHKSAKIGEGGLKTNQRYVDLAEIEQRTGQTWKAELTRLEGAWDKYLNDVWHQNKDWADIEAAYEELAGPRVL